MFKGVTAMYVRRARKWICGYHSKDMSRFLILEKNHTFLGVCSSSISCLTAWDLLETKHPKSFFFIPILHNNIFL